MRGHFSRSARGRVFARAQFLSRNYQVKICGRIGFLIGRASIHKLCCLLGFLACRAYLNPATELSWRGIGNIQESLSKIRLMLGLEWRLLSFQVFFLSERVPFIESSHSDCRIGHVMMFDILDRVSFILGLLGQPNIHGRRWTLRVVLKGNFFCLHSWINLLTSELLPFIWANLLSALFRLVIEELFLGFMGGEPEEEIRGGAIGFSTGTWLGGLFRFVRLPFMYFSKSSLARLVLVDARLSLIEPLWIRSVEFQPLRRLGRVFTPVGGDGGMAIVFLNSSGSVEFILFRLAGAVLLNSLLIEFVLMGLGGRPRPTWNDL
ncbi:hypothetical protein BpHYR1_001261 [Brachionus plicatilis]|uniref:Uncharacterized protein n=1 Tax=Brachionus plicatilis TaxID=10195 RepID=A0A3M7RCR2_BRAPC|nr:hypothetical protein BpHYR1_001261 [Brachionus plicatilis]